MIHKLTEDVIRLIAAGEVVEGPWSVVKELMENSLDAGASRVEVLLKGGGLDEITVHDDGCGMTEAEVSLAFERHTTSKIGGADDLDRITTLGFRGEALAAIAAVSNVTVITKPPGELLGSKLTVRGGKISGPTAEGAPDGTTVTVRSLFKNVPAREKFAGGKIAEGRKAAEQFRRIALARTGPEMKLTSNVRLLYACAGNSGIRERVGEILGWGELDYLLPLEYEAGDVRFYGYVSRPGKSWAGTGRIYSIINGRPARSRPVFRGLMAGYGGRLEKGRYPTAVVYLEIGTEQVDVNVHPRKEEVRFADEDAIYRVVMEAVSEVVEPYRPVVTAGVFVGGDGRQLATGKEESAFRVSAEIRETVEGYAVRHGLITIPDGEIPEEGYDFPGDVGVVNVMGPGATAELATGGKEIKVLGQLYNKYVIADTGAGLIVIDQHTAHERVIYERLKKAAETGNIPGQRLLVPETVRLGRDEVELVEDVLEDFAELGYELEAFGGDTYAVKSRPADLKSKDVGEFIRGVLDDFVERGGKPGVPEVRDRLLKSIACRAAVMAGDPLAPEEMAALVEGLLTAECPAVCPHGRPTMVDLPDHVLDRMFGRN
jgi:DNA mismatch repair protein MutL